MLKVSPKLIFDLFYFLIMDILDKFQRFLADKTDSEIINICQEMVKLFLMNNSSNLNSGFSVYLNKFKEKKYEFSLSNSFSNNRNRTSQNDEIKSFNTNNLSLDAGIYFREKWKLSTDYNLNTRQKTADFQDNLSNQLWNARLQRTFKKDEFTAYIMIRDILNQNVGINRYNYENIVGEEQNDRLKRYVMVGFTWNFKNGNGTEKK